MIIYLDGPGDIQRTTGFNFTVKDWNAIASDTNLGTASLDLSEILITGRYHQLPINGGKGKILVYACAVRLPSPAALEYQPSEQLSNFRLLLNSEGMHADGAVTGSLFFHVTKPIEITSLSVGLELEFVGGEKLAHLGRWGVNIIPWDKPARYEPGIHFWPFSFVSRNQLFRSHPKVVEVKISGNARWNVIGKKKDVPEMAVVSRKLKWYHKVRGFDNDIKYDFTANAYAHAPADVFRVSYHHVSSEGASGSIMGGYLHDKVDTEAKKLEETIDDPVCTGKTYTFKTVDEETGLPIGAPKLPAEAWGSLESPSRWVLHMVWRHKNPVSCEHFASDYAVTAAEMMKASYLPDLEAWGPSKVYPSATWEQAVDVIDKLNS